MGIPFNIKVQGKPRDMYSSQPANRAGNALNISTSNMHANAECGDERVLGYHPCSLDSFLCRQLALKWMGNRFLDPHYLPRKTVFLVMMCLRTEDSSAAALLLAVSGRLAPLTSDDSMERSARAICFLIPQNYPERRPDLKKHHRPAIFPPFISPVGV